MTATPLPCPHLRIRPSGQLTSKRAAVVAHLLGLGGAFAAIVGLIPGVTTLVRMLAD